MDYILFGRVFLPKLYCKKLGNQKPTANTVSIKSSLRSKRFRLVSEQKKTVERDFRFWPREKWNENQKMKEGGGGGEGRKPFPFFLRQPLPALLLSPFFARPLTLVPHSLLLNRTETLATQATLTEDEQLGLDEKKSFPSEPFLAGFWPEKAKINTVLL